MHVRNRATDTWKPSVPKSVLMLIAGTTWIGTAILLNYLAYSWLRVETPVNALWALVMGCACALLIHHFGFLRIVDRNLSRIHAMDDGRRCIFAFMSWKSYLLVMIMILTGIFLRHSPVPKLYLAVLYVAIGTALFLSSVRYLRHSMLTIRDGSLIDRKEARRPADHLQR